MYNRCNAAGFRLILALAMLTITWMALLPVEDIVTPVSINDKIAHLLAFVALAFLADRGWPERAFDWPAALWLLAYGALIELLQSTTKTRSAEFADLLADVAGIALYGFVIGPALTRWLAARR